MKTIFLLLFSSAVILSSCQIEECNCQVEETQIVKNDSIISLIMNQGRDNLESYWNRFDEPLLYNQTKE